jgi:membrane protease YdiL (CAAX protease family)
VLSALAMPFVDLPWWRVFRRCVSIAALASLWWLTRVRGGRSLLSYGLFVTAAGKGQLQAGLALGAAGLALLLGLGLATGSCQVDVTDDRLRLWRTVIGFVPAALLVGLLEELIFRGLILQHLLTCSRTAAVTISSALYAVVHLKSPSMTLLTWMELIGLFVLGAVLCLSYFATRQLWLAVGLHASLAYGARVNKLFVSFTDPSLAWLTGTSRLVNGLAGWIALGIIGGMLWQWMRRQEGGVAHGT